MRRAFYGDRGDTLHHAVLARPEERVNLGVAQGSTARSLDCTLEREIADGERIHQGAVEIEQGAGQHDQRAAGSSTAPIGARVTGASLIPSVSPTATNASSAAEMNAQE